MLRVWLPCLVLPLAFADPSHSFPAPAVQTADQKKVFEEIQRKAKSASAAATPAVLDFFDSAGFRSVLKSCCSAIAQLSSEELLRRYRAEAQAAELAHALHAERGNLFLDVTLKELGKMRWFPNEFQTALMEKGHNLNISTGSPHVNDMSQREIFGCKPFAGFVPTWSEASSRLIYTAHNMRRLDTASKSFFGDVTVVFNTSRIKDYVVIAPHDTGLFTMLCFHPEVRPTRVNLNRTRRHVNCSAWPKGLPMGTLEYLDHLILPNLAAGANRTGSHRTMLDAAQDLFMRSGMSGTDYADVPAISDAVMSEYLEADILANPQLPDAVKFVIGNFPQLFGTEAGEELQAISKRFDWPLIWAFGDGDPSRNRPPGVHGGKHYQSNQRIADPECFGATNASISDLTLSFHDTWTQAAALRRLRNATAADVQGWWQSLADQLHVGPITATSCGNSLHHCVAIDLTTRDCICSKPPEFRRSFLQ